MIYLSTFLFFAVCAVGVLFEANRALKQSDSAAERDAVGRAAFGPEPAQDNR